MSKYLFLTGLWFMWLLVGAVVLPESLQARATVEVHIGPEHTVLTPRIMLGDIATIEVLEPQAASLAQAIKQIDLGPAPNPGESFVLTRDEMENRISAARLILTDTLWDMPHEVLLNGPESLVTDEQLKDLIVEYLSQTEPYQSGVFEIISLNFNAIPPLPPEELTLRFVPQNSANPSYISGYIHFIANTRTIFRLRVTGQVDLSAEALVATRNLSRGHVLSEGDITMAMVPYAQTKESLSDAAMAHGYTLKMNLSAGEVLKARQLTRSIIVRRGETVTIIASKGALKITAAGQARQDGALGDTISVTNLSSQKTISARIIGPSQVEILF
ncbi:MAG: flagellar basal body P-ring formation chaperone FlgA [Candidatus Adiutrix sp.]